MIAADGGPEAVLSKALPTCAARTAFPLADRRPKIWVRRRRADKRRRIFPIPKPARSGSTGGLTREPPPQIPAEQAILETDRRPWSWSRLSLSRSRIARSAGVRGGGSGPPRRTLPLSSGIQPPEWASAAARLGKV